MENYRFGEYISFLRETLVSVVEYRERTGTLESSLLKIRDDLFDEDPFIVFGASLVATAVLADVNLYH